MDSGPPMQPEGFLFLERVLRDGKIVVVCNMHRDGVVTECVIDVDRLPGLARQALDIYTDLKGLARL